MTGTGEHGAGNVQPMQYSSGQRAGPGPSDRLSADDTGDELEAILRFAQTEISRLSDRPAAQIRDLTRLRGVTPVALVGHLDTAASVRRYQRKADEIIQDVPTGRLLDWGSFYGQMTYLLARRGLDVVPFDIEENRLDRTLAELVDRRTLYSRELVQLPFDSQSFDAVLSCGTLEHVADTSASLAEVRRVLKPCGRLLIYNLPNRYSWIEAINQWRGNAHERRYTLRGARRWLLANGFTVDRAAYENVLPCSFSSLRKSRAVLIPIAGLFRAIDPWLERVPITRVVATNLTLICTRR